MLWHLFCCPRFVRHACACVRDARFLSYFACPKCFIATLQASPELGKLFGLYESEDSNDGMAPFPVPSNQKGGGLAPLRAGGMDTPRGFEEELTEEEIQKRELEKVKRERDVLMNSILAARDQAGGSTCSLSPCCAHHEQWGREIHASIVSHRRNCGRGGAAERHQEFAQGDRAEEVQAE